MRHRVSGKRLSRTASHRRALRRNMAASLFQHGAIRTTEAKAKELRRFVERLITTARKGTLHARRQVIALLQDRRMADDDGEIDSRTVVEKLFSEIAPTYQDRPGGYTRIIRLSDRRIGDAGVQVILQLVEESAAKADQAEGLSRRKRRAAKRRQAAQQAPGPDDAQEEPEEQPEAQPDAEQQQDQPEEKPEEKPTEDPEEKQE